MREIFSVGIFPCMKMPVRSSWTWKPTYTFALLIVGDHQRVNLLLGIWLRPDLWALVSFLYFMDSSNPEAYKKESHIYVLPPFENDSPFSKIMIFPGKVCLHSSVKNCGFPEDDGSSKNCFTLFHLYSPKVNKVELLFHIKFTCKQYFHHFSL